MNSLNKFLNKTEGQANGCIYWTGYVMPEGYGQVRLSDNKVYLTHRAALILRGVTIPPKHDVDHQCHNLDLECLGEKSCLHRRCVNPNHLEPVTRSINLSRGRGNGLRETFLAKHAGHDLSSSDKRGRCLTCRREYYRLTGKT